MPLAIPMNRQRGGAWANVGGPGFTRDQMAMGQQDVTWAQQMDMFYAGLSRAETQFEETLAEQTRQYDVGFGERQRQYDLGLEERQREYDIGFGEKQRQYDVSFGEAQRTYDLSFAEQARQYDVSLGERQRTFDIRQEAWLKQFGFAEEQWGERKETMDIEQAQRTFDLSQARVRAKRATGEYEWRESERIAATERKARITERGPTRLEELRERLEYRELKEYGLRGRPAIPEGPRDPGGRALQRQGGIIPGGDRRGVRVAQPRQSLSERMTQFSAISEVQSFIGMQKEAAEERSRSRYPTFYGPTTPDPSYNASWEGYLSPTELGTAPDYGFGWQEEDEEEYVGPEFALY